MIEAEANALKILSNMTEAEADSLKILSKTIEAVEVTMVKYIREGALKTR